MTTELSATCVQRIEMITRGEKNVYVRLRADHAGQAVVVSLNIPFAIAKQIARQIDEELRKSGS